VGALRTRATASPLPSGRPTTSWRDKLSRLGWPAVTLGAALAVLAPLGFVVFSLFPPSTDVWREQWQTRLPGQLWDTAVLLTGVAIGTVTLGASLAWLTTAYRFPGSKVFSWLLIAPLAVPSYVLGFITLSVIGYTGPVQGWWRDVFGQDAWFPEVRSIWGAIVVFTLVLYPYVFLLARAALSDQAGGAYQVARSLGAPPSEAARRVVLPLLRPAIAAGAAIAMMETLTDFATVQYFDIETVSVGVFRIWRGTFDRNAAAEFASLVLAFALIVIAIERVARGRARFDQSSGQDAFIRPIVLSGRSKWLASAGCLSVLLLAFGAPIAQLVSWATSQLADGDVGRIWEQFSGYLKSSASLAIVASASCLIVAFFVANAGRFSDSVLVRATTRLSAAGYAVPGPVIAMGVLLTTIALDDALESIGLDLPGAVATGSFVGLVYAYSVRFLAPGLQAIESGLSQIPDELTASARTLGWRPARIAGRIHLPMARTSMVSAAVLVAVDAIKELPIALLLRPFGFDTLPIWTYNLASESRYPQASIPALAIVLVAMVPVAVLSLQLRRTRRAQEAGTQ